MRKIKFNGKSLNLDKAIDMAKAINDDRVAYCKQLKGVAQNSISKLNETKPTDLDKLHEQKIAYLTNIYFNLVNANKKRLASYNTKDIDKEIKHSLSSQNFEGFASNLETMLEDAKRVSEYSAKVTYQSVVDITSGVIELLDDKNKFLDNVLNENLKESDL